MIPPVDPSNTQGETMKQVTTAVPAILARLEALTQPLEVCSACGCLCRPDEVCPVCHPACVTPEYLFDGDEGPEPCENYGCPVADIIDGDDPGFVQSDDGRWIAVCSEACTDAVVAQLHTDAVSAATPLTIPPAVQRPSRLPRGVARMSQSAENVPPLSGTEVERLTALADNLAGRIARVEALTESATDFDEVGLGWVSVSEIRAALDGFPHEARGEHVTGNAYADPDRAADDLVPRGTIGVWPPYYHDVPTADQAG